MIPDHCRVEFVFSKLDRVVEAGPTAVEFLSKTQEKLVLRFGGRVANLNFRRIAARPEVEPLDRTLNDGLADALVAWTTAPVAEVDAGLDHVPQRDSREFAKYGWRNLARRKCLESSS
jgi:hypothetical protein